MEAKINDDFKLDVVSIRLVKDTPLFSKDPLDNPYKVVEALWEHLNDFDREVICVINLTSSLMPINVNFASVGALNMTLAVPRELFKSSILSNAAKMMLVHNHPSGSINPSEYDRNITNTMINLCKMMSIPLIDHIIIGQEKGKYFSMVENGLFYESRQNPSNCTTQAEKLAAETQPVKSR